MIVNVPPELVECAAFDAVLPAAMAEALRLNLERILREFAPPRPPGVRILGAYLSGLPKLSS